MKRRTFLWSTAAGICGLIGWQFATSSEKGAIVKVLYKRLPYLKLDGAGVQQFAAAAVARKENSRLKLSLLDATGPAYTHLALAPNGALTDAIRWGEERLVTEYLLSSDFFINGTDANLTVHFLGFYDPLVACSNPFARPPIIEPAT
jgi:hypothetical protein